ncbi:MAG: heavy-metal-associated domain-containing protein [Methanobrevibacter sp.]|nr:heavy-metal-associated domain-containing protein [Methanobrevibacter sp.]
MVEKTIKVVGMHCPSCVAAVELSLTDIDGVDEAKANIETGTVEIKLDDSVSDDDITEAVEDVGFKVE